MVGTNAAKIYATRVDIGKNQGIVTFYCARLTPGTFLHMYGVESHLNCYIIERHIGLEGQVKAEEEQKDGNAQSKDISARAAPQLFTELRWFDHLRRHEAAANKNG